MFDFEIDEGLEKSLVVFSGQLEGDDGDYGDEIDKILKERNTLYKELIFLCPGYLENEILSFINSGDRLLSNMDRAKKVHQINFVSFDGYGDLKSFHKVKRQTTSIADNPAHSPHLKARQHLDHIRLGCALRHGS